MQLQEPHETMDDIKRPVLPNFFPTFRVLHLWGAGCMLVETVLPSENRVMVSKIFDRRQLRKRQEDEPQFMPNSPEWDKEAKSHSCFLCHAKRQFQCFNKAYSNKPDFRASCKSNPVRLLFPAGRFCCAENWKDRRRSTKQAP